MIDPNSNDLILGSQLSRHHDLLPHLVRSERQGQAVIHHLNPPISPEGQLYTLTPENQDLKIVFRAMSDGSGFYPYDVYNPQSNDMSTDTLGATAGEYIVVPLRSTSAKPYSFKDPFVANVIGSKDDPRPRVDKDIPNSWLNVMRAVLKCEPTCQVTTQCIYTDSSSIPKKDIQGLIDAIKARPWEQKQHRSLDALDGGHVTLGKGNKRVEANGEVFLLAIPHWLNVLSYPDPKQDWGTTFSMMVTLGTVGLQLSGYMLSPK